MKKKTNRKPRNTLNELMIVNPGTPGNEEFLGLRQTLLNEDDTHYLGEDGTLYRMANFGTALTFDVGETDFDGPSLGQFFWGEDGTMYEVLDE